MINRPYEWSEFEKWSRLTKLWINYLPPSKPSLYDLNIYKALIRKYCLQINGMKALVLGATPELRDLLFELKADVSVVDRNPYMIEEMTRIRIYKNHEAVYIDDWFKYLPKNKYSFNLIVSDLTQSNIPYDMHDEFYQLVSNSLIPGGIFIDRMYTYRDNSKLYSATEEFVRFSKNPAINLLSLNELFINCFVASDLVAKLGRIDTHQIFMAMRNMDNPILNKYAEQVEEFLAPDGAVWYCGKDWRKVSNIYFNHFKPIVEIQSKVPAYKGIPCILVTTPKTHR